MIKTIISQMLDANMYLIEEEDAIIIIDPSSTLPKEYQNTSKDIIIFLTHAHFDHFYCLESYLSMDNITVYLHKNGFEKLLSAYKNCSVLCSESIEIKFDHRFKKISHEEVIHGYKVIENFGHTNCCISLLKDNCLFTGDFLFKGAIGRCDLYSSNPKQMRESLKTLFNLDKNLIVYPGHGESTILEIEFKKNRYLRIK